MNRDSDDDTVSVSGTRHDTLTVDTRFNGPEGSANGGYIGGRLAGALGGTAARVTLRVPPPLDTAMTVERPSPERVRLRLDDVLVAEAERAWVPRERVVAVSPEEARAAADRYRGREYHPFPTCFACGTARAEGDGLCLRPGPLETDPTTTACLWRPHRALAAPASPGADAWRVPPEIVWAALDCPSGWTGDIDRRPMLLGRMTAAVWGRPIVDRPYVITGRLLETAGRKVRTATTLYDESGTALAAAAHVWVRIDR